MWNYIKGYSIISIEGLELEKFLNMLARNGIYIFDIKRISSIKIEAKVYKDDLKNLVSVYESSRYNLKVKKCIGIPFVMRRIYKRKTLMIGGIISVLTLFILTTFITDVYIECPEGIDKVRLREEIYKCGLRPWANKYMVNRKDIRDVILYKFTDAAYISINLKGTNAYVEIAKKAEEPKEKAKINCNVIAKKNGIIEKTIARSGEAIVNKGDIVKKGDVLIAGGNIIAKGEIWARTYYEIKESAVYLDKKEDLNGKRVSIYKFIIKDNSYTLKRKVDFKNYIIKNKTYKLEYKQFKLPIKIEKSTFYEADNKKDENKIETMKAQIKEKATSKVDYVLPVQARIISRHENYKVNGDRLEFIIRIEALEDIGVEEKI